MLFSVMFSLSFRHTSSQTNEEDVVAKAKAYVQKIEAADMKGNYDTAERLSQEAENWLESLSESDQEKVYNALN